MGLVPLFVLLSNVAITYINDDYLRGATDESQDLTKT
jgi:hypothetical protein